MQQVPAARLFDELIKLFHSGKAYETLKLLDHHRLLQYLLPSAYQAMQHNPIAKNLVDLVCQTTDQRIQEGKYVSAAYLLASLLWHPLQFRMKELLDSGDNFASAFHAAVSQNNFRTSKSYFYPKRFSSNIREIWELQIRLENSYLRQIPRILAHPRLRAAYDFLLLRTQSGENPELIPAADWWTKFLTADEKQRQSLLSELPKQAKKPRKKRRR